jgi:uncharacterized protein (DUF488 family)
LKSASRPIFTIGHGTLSAEKFVELLLGAGIRWLVDVRSIPKSRHNPQFAGEALAETMREAGIAYIWDSRLGGFHRAPPDGSPDVALRHASFRNYAGHMRTVEFHEGRDELLADAHEGAGAILCSESLWWRCHRRLIADHLELIRSAPVLHLMHDGRTTPHRPTEGARIVTDDLVYDRVAGQEPLPLQT